MGAKPIYGRSGWGQPLAVLIALACACAGKAQRGPATREAGGEAATAGMGTSTDAGAGAGAPAAVDASGGGGTVSVTPFASCQQNTDCMITHRDCCAPCGDTQLENVVALSRNEFESYRNATCSAQPQACSTCTNFWNPYLVAHCVDGQCAALDLYQSPFTDCKTADDCRLRSNTCCPCKLYTSVISVSAAQEATLAAELCDADVDPVCDDCSSLSVTDYDAGCREGRCVLLAGLLR